MSSVVDLWADKLEIQEVYDNETHEIISAQVAIGSDYNKLQILRNELSEKIVQYEKLNLGAPKFICPICLVPVTLVCRKDKQAKKFHFRHRREDKNCPAITNEKLTKDQMNAMKYNGAKESFDHIEMKNIIAESLRKDPNFSNIQVEKVVKGMDRKEWRKPDVQAVWRGEIKIAFEVQLSTTFLHVVTERRLFYQRNNMLICWVFKIYRKDYLVSLMTQDDIFYHNNHNLFIANHDTLEESSQFREFFLECHWQEPKLDNNNHIKNEWNSKLVNFDELTIDQPRQRIFYYDFDRKNRELERERKDTEFRSEFEGWWTSLKKSPEGRDNKWIYFVNKFKIKGIHLEDQSETRTLLSALYSLKYGKVIGYKFKKLIEIANMFANPGCTNLLQMQQIFRVALHVYEKEDLIKKQDHKGTWQRKLVEIKKKIWSSEKYQINQKFDSLIRYLFPELMDRLIWDKLKKLDENYNRRDKET